MLDQNRGLVKFTFVGFVGSVALRATIFTVATLVLITRFANGECTHVASHECIAIVPVFDLIATDSTDL